MHILIAPGQTDSSHPLYQVPRTTISSRTVPLVSGENYLIDNYEAASHFLQIVIQLFRRQPARPTVTVDCYAAERWWLNALVHFKLLTPEIEILGTEAANWIDSEIAAIKQSAQIPERILDHYLRNVKYPTELYSNITPGHVVVAGCSFTAGCGLNLPEVEGYSVLLGETLGRPVINLSYPGSSIEYAANTLRQAPLTASNIVVWQLTSMARWINYSPELYPVSLPGVTFSVPVHSSSECVDAEEFQQIKKQKLRRNAEILFDTVGYLRNIGCKLVILEPAVFKSYARFRELVSVPEHDPGNDLATVDGELVFSHPGPVTHCAYAAAIMQKLNELYGIT